MAKEHLQFSMHHQAIKVKAVIFHLEGLVATPDRYDATAMTTPKATSDVVDLFKYLRSKKIRLSLVSPRSVASVQDILSHVAAFSISDFDAVISREDQQAHEQRINGVALAIRKMKLPPSRVMVVAADPHILREARKAGTLTVYFGPSAKSENTPVGADFQILRPIELRNIIRQSIPLPPGKLPNDLLRDYLNQFVFDDPSILVNPGVGEDTAAVNITSEEVLVLKSDPITFATDSIGQYAVLINANDIATSGAKPRWLLTTLLFPCGVSPYEIRNVIDELKAFCRQWDITLCGGHTEITDAVTRPVVTGMMAGTVARHNLIDKRNMAPGDRVLLTKGVAVEGTAIIAREFGDRLRSLRITESEIDSAREFLARISIITEARIAADSRMVSAMHDVTEGGLANAAEELSIAGGHGIRIDIDAIPVFSITRKICRLLGIDPLGLIGSGSLLICCRQIGSDSLVSAIQKAGIDVTCIGEVLEEAPGIKAVKQAKPAPWPQFEVDEITRLFISPPD
jgi:hydrogenase maturation factor/phosphoglycolate phosphatase-like HAD superfamily hydrolase